MHIEKAGITNSQNAEVLLIKGLTAEKLGNKMGGKQAVKMAIESNPYLSNCLTDGLKLGSLTIFAKDTLLVSSDGEAIRRDGRSRRMTSSPDGNNAKIVKEPKIIS